MKKYLKGEIYKLSHNKIIYILFFIILGYSIFANIVYRNNINLLYNNFNSEFLLLYIICIILFNNYLVFDDLTSGVIVYLKNNNYLLSKIIINLIAIILIFIFSFIICFMISLILFKVYYFKYLIDTIVIFIKLSPILIIIILISFIFSYLIKKSTYALALSYSSYVVLNYLNDLNMPKKDIFFITLNWNLNTSENVIKSLIIILIYMIMLFKILYKIFNKN